MTLALVDLKEPSSYNWIQFLVPARRLRSDDPFKLLMRPTVRYLIKSGIVDSIIYTSNAQNSVTIREKEFARSMAYSNWDINREADFILIDQDGASLDSSLSKCLIRQSEIVLKNIYFRYKNSIPNPGRENDCNPDVPFICTPPQDYEDQQASQLLMTYFNREILHSIDDDIEISRLNNEIGENPESESPHTSRTNQIPEEARCIFYEPGSSQHSYFGVEPCSIGTGFPNHRTKLTRLSDLVDQSVENIPLSYDCANVADLFLARSIRNFVDDFESEEIQSKVSNTYVCDKHLNQFVYKWHGTSSNFEYKRIQGQRFKMCSIKKPELEGHSTNTRASGRHYVTRDISRTLLGAPGSRREFLPIGPGKNDALVCNFSKVYSSFVLLPPTIRCSTNL